jgi:uncharacterized protein YggE
MNTIQQNFTDLIQSNNLRKNLFTLILIFIALFLIVKTVLTYKEAVDYKNINNVSYISVNGKSEIYAKPDTLTFNININEEGKDNAEVTKKVAEKEKKAIEILKANGVKEENIKLQGYNTQDKYNTVTTPCSYTMMSADSKMQPMIARPCESTDSKIVGQTINQTMEVKIRDIDTNANAEIRTKIMSELSAQNIKADGFTFVVYDVDTIKKQMREKAIANAKVDAKKLAKELGVRLDVLSSFSDNNGMYPMYGMGGDAMMSKSSAETQVTTAPELTPGQQKITSNVTLTYSIK